MVGAGFEHGLGEACVEVVGFLGEEGLVDAEDAFDEERCAADGDFDDVAGAVAVLGVGQGSLSVFLRSRTLWEARRMEAR